MATEIAAIYCHICPCIFLLSDLYCNKLCFSFIDMLAVVGIKIAVHWISFGLKLIDAPTNGYYHYYIEIAELSVISLCCVGVCKMLYCIWFNKFLEKKERGNERQQFMVSRSDEEASSAESNHSLEENIFKKMSIPKGELKDFWFGSMRKNEANSIKTIASKGKTKKKDQFTPDLKKRGSHKSPSEFSDHRFSIF